MSSPVTLRPFYADWAGYNRRTIEGIRGLSAEDLALPVQAVRDDRGDPWPIWAVFGHTAAMRVFWLCDVFGEPGAELTPFGGETPGWEDDLTQVRTADELAGAFETTWSVVEGCLSRWTPDTLGVERRRGERTRAITSGRSISRWARTAASRSTRGPGRNGRSARRSCCGRADD